MLPTDFERGMRLYREGQDITLADGDQKVLGYRYLQVVDLQDQLNKCRQINGNKTKAESVLPTDFEHGKMLYQQGQILTHGDNDRVRLGYRSAQVDDLLELLYERNQQINELSALYTQIQQANNELIVTLLKVARQA